MIMFIYKPKLIIPIHTENPNAFEKMELKNCSIKLVNDEEVVVI